MATVTLTDIRKSFAGSDVLRGVSVDIREGEMIVVVGPSGCGKSTLLRIVAGLETMTSGEVRIGERVVNGVEPKDRNIAMVFQNYALYPHMSVYDNMAYGLKIRGLPRAEVRQRVERAAAALQIESLLERKPRQLSGGQRQRVAMGRALVREPAVFLFDEPLSNLDAKLRVQVRLEIRQLQRALGITSIYVTHDQVEAMTLADRLIVMNGGVAEQIGPPIELYALPATLFVAGFIGSPAMNIVRGALTSDGRFAIEAGGFLKPREVPPGLAVGRFVTIGVRPEHLVPDPDGEKFPVDLVEALGADTLVHGGMLPNSQNLVARLPGSFKVRQGDAINLAAAVVHLFDPATGLRLDPA
jgi:sn-glycerol 3-phosphate transport system ATP-binding protein